MLGWKQSMLAYYFKGKSWFSTSTVTRQILQKAAYAFKHLSLGSCHLSLHDQTGSGQTIKRSANSGIELQQMSLLHWYTGGVWFWKIAGKSQTQYFFKNKTKQIK